MKYYQLSHSIVTDEVGMTFPQSQTSRESLPIDHPQHLWQQKAGILNNVALPEPVVHPDAKLSDLLSTTATWRLVMSPKLKVILEKYIKEAQCQFLEMKVHYLSEEYEYWMLNPLEFNMEVIDFGASEIWLCGAGNTKMQKLEIKNVADFETCAQDLQKFGKFKNQEQPNTLPEGPPFSFFTISMISLLAPNVSTTEVFIFRPPSYPTRMFELH